MSCLYRQWFKGIDNVVADSLSRDALFLNCETHKSFLEKFASNQIPENFRIVQVKDKIYSFVISVLRSLPVKKQRLIAPKPSELLLSSAGDPSLEKLESLQPLLTHSPGSKSISPCQHLHKPSENISAQIKPCT